MYKLMLVVFLFIGSVSFSFAEEGDSTKAKPQEKFEKKLTDKTDPSIKQRRGRRDLFIDKDGDGICDNRAKGMSFERQRKRQHSGNSGHGNGNSGGNK